MKQLMPDRKDLNLVKDSPLRVCVFKVMKNASTDGTVVAYVCLLEFVTLAELM